MYKMPEYSNKKEINGYNFENEVKSYTKAVKLKSIPSQLVLVRKKNFVT